MRHLKQHWFPRKILELKNLQSVFEKYMSVRASILWSGEGQK
jgi:hypothetical protein